jgi:hypothetical protein
MKDNQERQGVFQEIIAERREKLAPKQGRKAAGQQQRLGCGRRWVGHGASLCQKRAVETSLLHCDRRM